MSEQDDIGSMFHDAGQMREALRRNGLEQSRQGRIRWPCGTTIAAAVVVAICVFAAIIAVHP